MKNKGSDEHYPLLDKSIRTNTIKTFNLDSEIANRSHQIDCSFLAGVEGVEQMNKWLDF